MIKYMGDPVDEECLLKVHNITHIKLYKLKANAVNRRFYIDGNEYLIVDDAKRLENQKEPKNLMFTISKGNRKYSNLKTKEVSVFVERGFSMISNATIKTGSAVINGWLVERE